MCRWLFDRMYYYKHIVKATPVLSMREEMRKKNKLLDKKDQMKLAPLPNPYYEVDVEQNVKLPSKDYTGPVGYGTFKGCRDPKCMESGGCKANTKFVLTAKEGCIYGEIHLLGGSHSDKFYVDSGTLSIRPDVKKEATSLLNDRTMTVDQVKRALTEKFGETEDNYSSTLSSNKLSKLRYTNKIKQEKSADPFTDTQIWLRETLQSTYDDLRYIKKVGINNVASMTTNNFIFLLYSKKILEKCRDCLNQVGGWDALFKMAYINSPDVVRKREGKVPVSAWTTLDNCNRPCAAFIVISADYNFKVIEMAMKAIENELREL